MPRLLGQRFAIKDKAPEGELTMANSLPWSVKGVDPRTREAAKAAARRAGLTLGEWLDTVVRDEAETEARPPERDETPEPGLDELNARLRKLSQNEMQAAPPPRPAPEMSRGDLEAVLAKAAFTERLTRDASQKTAGALDSIARWMEKTESRLSSGERSVAERQERATGVIADAIKSMGERLAEIERRSATDERRPAPAQARPVLSRDSLASAVSDIRSRQRLLDGDRAGFARADSVVVPMPQPQAPFRERQPAPDPTLAALRDDVRALSARLGPLATRDPASQTDQLRADIAQMRKDMAALATGRGGDSRSPGAEAALSGLREDIRALDARLSARDPSSQTDLVRAEIAQMRKDLASLALSRNGETRSPAAEAALTGLREEVRALAGRIGARDTSAQTDLLRAEMAQMHKDMLALAPGGQTRAIERALIDLQSRIDQLDSRDQLEPVLLPLARIEAEVARLSSDRPNEGQSRIANELSHLSDRIHQLDSRDRMEPVLLPLARIEAEVARLAGDRSTEGYGRIEHELSHLSARIDALAHQSSDRSALAPILRDIAELRDLVAGSGNERRLDDLGQQLSALSGEIGRMRESQPDGRDLRSLALSIEDVRSAIMNDRVKERPADGAPLMALSRQVEALASRLEMLPTLPPAAIDGQVSQILRRLDEISAAGRPASDELSRRIEALVINLEAMAARAPSDVERRIDALQVKLEELAERGPAGIERQIEALSSRIEALTASNNLASIVHEAADGAPMRVDFSPVEAMLRGLAHKIDAAGRADAGRDDFDALERQISSLAERLDATAATRSAETGIERTLQELVHHLEGLRADTNAAAERAARAAVADLGDRFGDRPAEPAVGFGELSELMSGLRETHVSAERQTQDALGAVHRTLDAIMQRLNQIERDGQADRAPARPVQPMAVAAPAAAPPPVDIGRSDATGLNAMLKERFGLGVKASTEPRVKPAETPLDLAPTGQSALDRPLEPGSGRPRLGHPAPAPDAAAAKDPQNVRQNLIAAARRSARAATEAAAVEPGVAEPAAVSSGGRLKEIMEKRKRPLLLGLAAVVLAMGTAQVVTGGLIGGKRGAPQAEGEARIETPAASESVQPAPATPAAPDKAAKDQSSALPPLPIGTSQAVAAPVAGPEPGPVVTGSTIPPVQSAALPAQLPPEPVKPVTGVSELPSMFGTPGMRRAALAGDARAVYEVATKAADGQNGNRDPKLALRLFERAAVAGLTPAQFRLGNMFEKGIGTARDPALARVWYARAAERGNAKAMHNLAVLHAEGTGGNPDYATATEWFRRAAEHGVRDSQYNLAILLGRGLGAPADLGQSYLWFAVAAAQGDEDAGRKRDEVAARLPAGELATAKARAQGWTPKPLEPAANEVAAPAKGWDVAPATSSTGRPASAKAVRG